MTESEQRASGYELLKAINAVVITTSDKTEFMSQIREALSKSRLFALASISLVDPLSGELEPEFICCNRFRSSSSADTLYAEVLYGHCNGTAKMLRLYNDLSLADANLPWCETALRVGLHFFASLPIHFEDKFFGILALFSDSIDGIDTEIIELLQQIADSVAYALSMREESVDRQAYESGLSESRRELRELLLHLHTAREDERRLVAHELYDELGQTLNTLKLDLSTLGNNQPIKLSTQKKRLTRMTEAIDHALDEVHRVVTALCPRILSDLGLAPAVEWLVEEFSSRSGISCSLKLDLQKSGEIPRATATTAFRCIQESLNNIVSQHTTVSSASIHLMLDRKVLNLSISDNGQAHSGQSGPTANSFANFSMRQRVEIFGGSLKRINRSGHGTCIEISLPIVESAGQTNSRRPSDLNMTKT